MSKKSGFDLKELMNQRSLFKEDAKGQQEQEDEMEIEMLDIYDLVPLQENFYSTEEIEDLKFSIGLLGVLQPLLVKPEGEKYKIQAGHRRRLACISLLEDEKLEKYRYVPCVIKTDQEEKADDNKEKELDHILERLTVIMANSFREKTEWEKMEEALQQETLIEELRKIIKVTGRTRTILKEITGGKVKEAQMGRYKAIKNNLCQELMEKFRENSINVSVAYEVSGMSLEYQKNAYEILRRDGTLSLPEVKKLKNEEEQKKIPGQLELVEQNYREDEEQDLGQDLVMKTTDKECMNIPEEDLEFDDPQPESVISLCYSCIYYSTCKVKNSTVKSCNTYKNKAEAEKTEEQKYSEEQDKIDRETKKELQRQQDEDRWQQLPDKAKKVHEIRLPTSRWDDITRGTQTFLLIKNDDYKVNDEINMQEYKDGKKTDRSINAEIVFIIDEHSGLVEGYCIIGIKVEEAGGDTI